MDIRVENHGSIVLLRGETERGRDWLEENLTRLDGEEPQRWGGAIVCEPRYVANIVQGAQTDGLEVA